MKFYWVFSQNGWKKEFNSKLENTSHLGMVNLELSFKKDPSAVFGDELNMISVFEHESMEDHYAIHFILQDFSKFIVVQDFPSMILIIKKLSFLLELNLELLKLLDDGESDQSTDTD